MNILEKLDTEVRLPYDEEALLSKDPVRIADYLLELVKATQELLEKLTVISNYSVDLATGEAVYYALPQDDGTYPDGTWRRIQNGESLEDQKKIDGAWVMAQRREPPE
ncbi:hypothetical protein LCGC14_2008040 [marine sediment metagenome]|uniref:Uncharacterized protein n=1 Tax=marine sediment metagenome TaxID=412755 RepID=A0A0F9HEH0_9ZZZZ